MFEQLRAGDHYLIRLRHRLRYDDLKVESQTYGELHFEAEEVAEDYLGLTLSHYSFSGQYRRQDDRVGVRDYTFLSRVGSGVIERAEAFGDRSDDVWQLTVSMSGALAQNSDLESTYLVQKTGGFVVVEAAEPVAAELSMAFVVSDSDFLRSDLEIVQSSLTFESERLRSDAVVRNMELMDARFSQLASADGELLSTRNLNIKPYLVHMSEAPDIPPEERFGTFREQANAIWGKGCSHFGIAPSGIRELEADDLPAASDIVASIAAWTDDEFLGNAVPVFVVGAEILEDDGGGFTQVNFELDDQLMLLFVVKKLILSGSGMNDHLLAHELGHALGGVHPEKNPSDVQWQGDQNTILEDTSDLDERNPPENSEDNCRQAYHPNMFTSDVEDCIPQYDF